MMNRAVQIIAVVIISSLLWTITVSGQGLQEVRQWASKATATSQYSEMEGWQAFQATGEPDTLECGDIPTAWESATADGQDTLTVMFTEAVFPTEVHIHQNWNPGAIVEVRLVPDDGSEAIVIPGSADTDVEDCPHIFSLEIDPGAPLVSAVEIDVDQTITDNWNAIDAVELVGLVLPGMGSDDEEEDSTPAPLPTEVNEDVGGEPVEDQPYVQPGYAINCDTTFGDANFNNGTEFFMYLPNGNRFTFTAVGIGDFDPVIAILDPSNYGTCNDDSNDAAAYGARLPTTGDVNPNGRSAQLVLDVEYFEPYVPYTVVVGSRNSTPGEFLLFIEGGFSEYGDGIGDVYSMRINPGMVASGVQPTAYMIGIVQAFDAYIYLVNEANEALIDEANKSYVACDNAGQSCWGTSYSMVGAAASRSGGRAVGGGSLDAMMQLPIGAGDENIWMNSVMVGNGTYGDYMQVYHVGVGDPNQ